MNDAWMDEAALAPGGFDPFGRDPEMAARLQPVLDALLDRVFRVVVQGQEKIPAAGRALLVANHGGALPWDALVLHAALSRADAVGRPVRPLVEDAVMTAPFLGTFLTRLGCARASQENAVRLLAKGEVVAVFPEGMQGLSKLYRRKNRLMRFGRGGFVRLALRTTTPVFPVAIVGGEDTAPLLAKLELFFKGSDLLPYLPVTPLFPFLGPLGLLPLPARWRIRIGDPVDVAAICQDPDDAVSVGEAATVVRDRIQKDILDLVEQRGGAYFG